MGSLDKFKIIRDPNDYFEQLEQDDKLAIAASRELFVSSTSVEERRIRLKKRVHCFNYPEHIHEYSLRILARKDFPLLKELNGFIERVNENGCIDKWLKRYRFVAEKQPIYEYAIATVESYASPSFVCCCIFLLALFTTMIEMIVYSKVRTPNPSKFWRFMEIIVDTDRSFLLDDLDWNT